MKMTLCNYQTNYFLKTIVSAVGRRYNSFEESLVGKNISRDDVAGFFRTLLIQEKHLLLLQLANQLQITEADTLITAMEIKLNQFKKLRETCLLTGLLFENYIKTEDKEYFWYMVDTGGIYALEEAGVAFNKLPFTLSIEQKYKLYLKSQCIYDISDSYDNVGRNKVKNITTDQIYNVELLEEVTPLAVQRYRSTIFVFNLAIAAKLNINDDLKALARTLQKQNNVFYDLDKKTFLEIRD